MHRVKSMTLVSNLAKSVLGVSVLGAYHFSERNFNTQMHEYSAKTLQLQSQLASKDFEVQKRDIEIQKKDLEIQKRDIEIQKKEFEYQTRIKELEKRRWF